MAYKLFLDDERFPPDMDGEGYRLWVIVRNYNEFVECLQMYGMPEFISFDHDLGDSLDGYECAKWLGMRCVDSGTNIPEFYVHSQNPVGANNINFYLASAQKFIDISRVR